MKIYIKLIYLFLTLLVLFCDIPETTTESKDNINLAYSIGFKANECGNYPNYPLYIPSGEATPAQRDVQACSLTIIQQKCPFVNYPYYCLKIFKNLKFENPVDKEKD